MKITVEDRHVVEAEPKETERCAIALAIKEQTGAELVCVYDVSEGYIDIDGTAYTYPKEVEAWIDAFDSGVQVVTPFIFELESD